MVGIRTIVCAELVPLTASQPTVTISRARLRTLRAARTVDHVKRAEGSDSISSAQAATPRQETLNDFLQEISPLARYRVALLWLSLLVGLLLSTKDVRYARIPAKENMLQSLSRADVTRNDDSIGPSTARIIADDLGDSEVEALWLALTPSLIYATFCFVVSRLSTVFGRRNTVLVSFALFTAFSATCGAAGTFHSLVASQIGQAAGGTGLYCMAMVVMPDVTPVTLIPFLPSIMGGTAIAGSLLGPVAGGLLAASGYWRWFYWMNVPIALLAAGIFAAACPERTRAERLEEQKLSALDWKGSLLIVATCGFSTFGLQQAALQAPAWSSLFYSVPLRTGLVCGALLLHRQYYPKEQAHILPVQVIADPVLLAQILLSLLAGCSYTFLTVMLPMRFEVVNFLTASEIFVHVAPFTLAFAIGTSLCGLLLRHWRRVAALALTLAWLLISIGNGLLMTVDNDYDVDPKMYGYMVLAGLGTGIACASCTFGATLYCRPQDTATVQGLTAQARVLGGVLVMASFTAIFNGQLISHLHEELAVEHIVQIQTNHTALKCLTTEQKFEVRRTFASSSSEAVAYCAVSAVIGLGVSLLVSRRRTHDLESKAREVQKLLFSSYKPNSASSPGLLLGSSSVSHRQTSGSRMTRIFITGSTDGIGQAAAKLLSEQGLRVTLHARSVERAAEAKKAVPNAEDVLIGDISTIQGAKDLAAKANAVGPWDAIVHNAGLGPSNGPNKTADGFQSTFAVNSLAPYILTCLMDKPKRLLYVTSVLHSGGDDSLDDITWARRSWSPFQAYSDSKLQNVMLSNAVARAWPDVQSCSHDPGWVQTKLGGYAAPGTTSAPAQAIAAFAAGESDIAGNKSGVYFDPQGAKSPHRGATDKGKQDRFVSICEQLSGITLPK